ncbi:MAG: CoA pyrophosphatase [Deltaproteobacteria bacterium]|nr:CoA pyrophosphatase [Deltaproteobacteria bacterium]
MCPSQQKQKENTIELIIDRLGRSPNDFSTQMRLINERKEKSERWLAAGVLLLLSHKGEERPAETDNPCSGFVFQLIKRSERVPQGGDLSCPGGILDPAFDGVFSRIIRYGLPPVMTGDARRHAELGGAESLAHTCLFLANAMREAWEEIRLSPFNVHYLGALPCYNLTLFTKTIFPVVGLVKKDNPYRLNGEVDKIVEIPVSSFFDEKNYAVYSLEASDRIAGNRNGQWEFPCLIHVERNDSEEILWGATFNIIISFLTTAFAFDFSRINPTRVVTGTLEKKYLAGTAIL